MPFRRYWNFSQAPTRVDHLPSVGKPIFAATVRSRRGLGLQARFNATPQAQPLLACRQPASATGVTWVGYVGPYGYY